MEPREKYIARLIQDPAAHGLTEARMVNMPQIVAAHWVRLKCQYSCRGGGNTVFYPPQTPTSHDTAEVMETYRFGLLVRHAAFPKGGERGAHDLLSEFQQSLLRIEEAAATRGYSRAFVYGAGNCVICQGGDEDMRPCDYPGKARPTLEASGIDLAETLRMIAWDDYLLRKPGDPLSLFGLLLLE